MRRRHYREGGLAGASSPLSFGGDPINNQTNRPQMKLEGTDGNIFAILGKATQLLRGERPAGTGCRNGPPGVSSPQLRKGPGHRQRVCGNRADTPHYQKESRGRTIEKNTALQTSPIRTTPGSTASRPCGISPPVSARGPWAASSSQRTTSARRKAAGSFTTPSLPRRP